MHILYLGSFAHSWSTENYIARALERTGCEVIRLEESEQTHESIVQAAAERRPDCLLFAKGRFRGANGDWPAAAGSLCKLLDDVRPHVGSIVCWMFDLVARQFAADRFAWASAVAAACDRFVTTDGSSAPELPKSLVIRQGAPDDVDHDCLWQPESQIDVLFLGTAYRDRQQLVDALARRFGQRFQHVNDCRGAELTQLVRSARLCVGPHYPHFANYWSNRLYVIAGHGGLFAGPNVAGMNEEGWRSGENFLALPLEPEQMAAKLEEYLTRHDRGQLETVRQRAYEFAQTHCSYDVRVAALLSALAPTSLPDQSPVVPSTLEPSKISTPALPSE